MTGFKFFVFLLGAILVLSSCSSTPGKKINYRDSVVTPTLEIPPDLLSRSAEKNLTLPGSKVGTAANKGRFVETGDLKIEERVLPVLTDFKIVGEGDFYWLEVAKPVDKVYPLIRAFWAEQGFQLIKDEPLIGFMDTEWMSLKSGKKSLLSSFLESFRSAESRDQYRTRVERHGDQSRVYVSHRGQEQIIDENTTAWKPGEVRQGWQFVPSDQFKAVEMLSRLMIYLGLQDDRVKQELDKIGSFESRTYLDLVDVGNQEESVLMVRQGFAQTWNRLVYHLDKLNIAFTVIQKENNSGSILPDANSLIKLCGKLDKLKQHDRLLISLQGGKSSDQTKIEIQDKAGQVDRGVAAGQLLNFLLEQLR